MRFKVTAWIVLTGCAFSVSAQQKPQYTQYLFDNLLLNPATAGIESYTDVKAGYRSQWTGLYGAPVTSYLTVSQPVGDRFVNGDGISGGNSPYSRYYDETYQAVPSHHGLGLTLVSDKAGPFSVTDIMADYAYHIGLADRWNLALGVGAGLENNELDASLLQLTDPGDMTIFNASGNHWQPQLNAGAWAYSGMCFAGVSAWQLLPLISSQGTPLSNSQHLNWFMTAGYKFFLSDDVSLIPSAMLKFIDPLPVSCDLNMKVAFSDRFWVGGAFRTRDGIAGLAGFNVSSLLNIGYSYDYSTTALRGVNTGTHEIVIALLLNNKSRVVCPEHTF